MGHQKFAGNEKLMENLLGLDILKTSFSDGLNCQNLTFLVSLSKVKNWNFQVVHLWVVEKEGQDSNNWIDEFWGLMLERTEVYIAVILMRIREWSRIKGCICSKGTASNEYVEKSAASKEATKTSKLSVSSSKRDEAAFEVDDISNQLNGSSTFVSSDENKKQSAKASPLKACRLLSLTNGDKKKHKLLLVGLLG